MVNAIRRRTWAEIKLRIHFDIYQIIIEHFISLGIKLDNFFKYI